MSGTFRIFRESENSPLSLEKSNKLTSISAKSVGSTGVISSKSYVQSQVKSKGLSVRSKSDLNVFVSNNCKSKSSASKDFSKLLEKKCTQAVQKLSPNKLKLPMNKVTNLTAKEVPLSLSPIKQNVGEFVFRRPITPPNPKKSNNPEPEKLYYDFDQRKLLDEEIEMVFKEDLDWIKSTKSLEESKDDEPIEDEGFISDGDIDRLELHSDNEDLSLDQVELPEISDLDDSV